MAISFDSTLLGPDLTGFTTPIIVNVADSPPKATAVQQALTAESSGTFPSGVTFHSVTSPFTFTIERPTQFKTLQAVNPVTGVLSSVPRNVWTLRTRKGVTPLAGQAAVTAMVETKIHVPAGADTADPANLRLMLVAHFGETDNLATQIGDAIIDGIL